MKKTISILVVIISLFFVQCKKEKENCKEKAKINCVCTLQYDPVCGCNGITYGNACGAECNGITDYKQGACK